jgi:Cu2+-containing amine oxidase
LGVILRFQECPVMLVSKAGFKMISAGFFEQNSALGIAK